MSNLDQTIAVSNPSSQTAFSREVLAALKAPESLGNVIFLNSWQQREEPSYTASPGANNPLNLEEAGDAGTNGVFGVFSSMQAGAQATADNIAHGYPSILKALQSGTAYQEDAKGTLSADFLKWSSSKNDPGYTNVTLTEDNLTSSGYPGKGEKLTTGQTASTGGTSSGWWQLVTGALGVAASPSAAPTVPGGVLGSGELNPNNVVGDLVAPGAAASNSGTSIAQDLEILAGVLVSVAALYFAISHLTTGGLMIPGVGVAATPGGGLPELWWCVGAAGALVLWSVFSKQSPLCVVRNLTSSTSGNCKGTLDWGSGLKSLVNNAATATTAAGTLGKVAP